MSILDSDWEPNTAVGMYPGDIPAVVDGGPRRGSLQDFGGTSLGPALEDEDPRPPRDGSFPYADMFNAIMAAAAAAEKVHFVLGISVALDAGGVPVISKVTGPSQNAKAENVELVVNGPGDVTISWEAGLFPPPILEPSHSLNDLTVGGGITAQMLPSGLGVRVLTWTGTNTAAARPFTVKVW